MGNIIDLADRLRDLCQPTGDDISGEKFLLEEGLELLAAYRLIQDEEVRSSIKRAVEAIAMSARPKPDHLNP